MLANIYKKKDLRNITNVNPLDFTGPYVSSSRLAIGNLFKKIKSSFRWILLGHLGFEPRTKGL